MSPTIPKYDVQDRSNKLPWLMSDRDILFKSSLTKAILFHGRIGLGKSLMAINLAKKILCPHSSKNDNSCDDCKDCHLVDINAHPDLVVLPDESEKKSKIDIEEIRGLLSFATKSSHRGQGKIVILNKADQFSRHTGNAILKVLEENQNSTYFFLVAEKLSEVMPTIKSRCLKTNIKQPSKEVALTWLSENTENSTDNLAIGLAISGFAPLRAKTLIEDKSFWDNRTRLLKSIIENKDLERFISVSEKMESSVVANTLLMLAFDVVLYQTVGKIQYNLDCHDFIASLAKNVIQKSLFNWYSSILVYSKQSSHGLNNRLALENLFLSSPI